MKLNTIKGKINRLFNQGLTPIKLSQSILVAGALSIVPILGVTTFVLTALSLKRKLNLPIMIAISYLMWPIQLLLVIPFIRIGEFIFSIPPTNHTTEEIIHSFKNSFFQTLSHLSFELMCGVAGWFFTIVPIFIGIYTVTFLFLKRNEGKLIN